VIVTGEDVSQFPGASGEVELELFIIAKPSAYSTFSDVETEHKAGL